MAEILNSLATWFHALATVIFIGYFVLMGLIFIPTAVRSQPPETAGAILADISKRSRNWMYLALIIFAVTGYALMLIDPNYQGIGNFNNTWCLLMLVKHVVIMGMIAAGFWFNFILRIGPMLQAKTAPHQALRRFRTYNNWMAIAGVVVLLLTAFSQFE